MYVLKKIYSKLIVQYISIVTECVEKKKILFIVEHFLQVSIGQKLPSKILEKKRVEEYVNRTIYAVEISSCVYHVHILLFFILAIILRSSEASCTPVYHLRFVLTARY